MPAYNPERGSGPQDPVPPGPGVPRTRCAQEPVPLWPSTFEPDTAGGEMRILDGERMVARVGKAVEMYGGDLWRRCAVARRAPKY